MAEPKTKPTKASVAAFLAAIEHEGRRSDAKVVDKMMREITGKKITDIAPDEVGRVAVSQLGYVPSDLHGSAAYRTRVGAAMVARAWADATSEALRGEARNG